MRVLITGASSGIGAATAVLLAAEGADLLLSGWQNHDGLDRIAKRTGGRALVADLTTRSGCEALAAEAGSVDALVANAGIGWAGPTVEMDGEAVERLVALNLTAPILLTRALLPGMYERGQGRLVFVTSIAGELGVRDEAVYSATKSGLARFAESLRYEAAPHGVVVSIVVPGVVDTPFFARRGRAYARRRPHPIPPERVATAIRNTLRTGRPDTVVPGWLALPARLHGVAPELYRSLARRQTS